MLRSLAYALLAHEGDNPRDRDAEADRPYRRNQELVEKVRTDWLDGSGGEGATLDLLSTLRQGANDEACDLVVKLLNDGVAPQAIWDALHLGAGELLMRQPGIVALHAMTTTNALRFAYETARDDRTRLFAMLQNAAFLPMFLDSMGDRGRIRQKRVDELAAEASKASPQVDEIFAELGRDRDAASLLLLERLQREGHAAEIIDAARVLTFLKGDDAHDYKFSSAALEDYYLVSPAWRDRYLATSAYNFCHALQQDNSLVDRTRAAFGASSEDKGGELAPYQAQRRTVHVILSEAKNLAAGETRPPTPCSPGLRPGGRPPTEHFTDAGASNRRAVLLPVIKPWKGERL